MENSFPFSIEDVMQLCDIPIKRKTPYKIKSNCPFCNDTKGRLEISIIDNVFCCHRCNESGGMLSLYAKCYGIADNSEAYREICDLLKTSSTSFREKKKKPEKIDIPMQKASLDDMHQTYSMLIAYLKLSNTHRNSLQKRGLTSNLIEQCEFRSVPSYGIKQLVEKLEKSGCVLEGVPGFYKDSYGWNLSLNPKMSGILIPIRSFDNKIQGFQIRLDQPIDGTKYIWLSSSDKPSGVSCGSPVHFVGDTCVPEVILTEGALKADIIHSLTGHSVLAIAGVNQTKELPYILELFKSFGITKMQVAFDIDRVCNRYVRKALGDVIEILKRLSLQIQILYWDFREKGYDDYLFAEKHGRLNKTVPFFIQNRISYRLLRAKREKIQELIHISSNTQTVKDVPNNLYSVVTEGTCKARDLGDVITQLLHCPQKPQHTLSIFDMVEVRLNGEQKLYCAAPGGFLPATWKDEPINKLEMEILHNERRKSTTIGADRRTTTPIRSNL